VLTAAAQGQRAGTVHPPAPVPEKGAPRMTSWETFYHQASPAQRAELLALAGAQGVLYAHRLPAVPKGTPGTEAAGELAALCVLTRLLAGQVEELPPARPGEVAFVDTSLDGRQRDAVARALATPDVCLIQGPPGTGKSRVVAEILTQVAARGGRVLFVAPSGAALDRVLEALADRAAVCGLRCLGRDEQAEALPPAAGALTAVGRARLLREQTLPAARASLEEGERRLERRSGEEPVWPQLLDFAENRQRLGAQLDDLLRRREALAEEVEREAGGEGPLAASVAECLRAHEDRRRDLETARAKAERQRTQQQQELADLAARRDALRPLAEAKRRGRWWSLAWWRATFRGRVPDRLTALEAEHARAAAALEAAEGAIREAERALREAEEACAAEQRRLREAEVGRRQADLADQEAALRDALGLLQAKGEQLLGRLGPDVSRPEALTVPAVREAQEQWQARRAHDGEARDLARQWAAYLETAADRLAADLPAYANVVAAPFPALRDDPLADAAGPFDLLLVEEADRVTEAELLQAARRARRWVLVGEAAGECEPAAPVRPAAPGRARPRPPAALAPGCFQRLWGHLHCDPSRLPYAWARESDRLCCRLHPVPPDQRHRLETERVADSPDVELRILNLPRATPVLAEVVFPPAMSIHEAKGYIYRELQELPVQALGRSACWDERPDALVFRMGSCGDSDAQPVALEQGVREMVASGPCGPVNPPGPPPPWHTCRLEFDRAQGWGRERAEEWVRRHLRLRDLGRTAHLDTPHRMAPPLAAVVSDLLGYGSGPAEADGPGAAVEFVAVPPLERPRGRPRPAAAPALPRAGAGLELDLTAPRHADRLPTELRAALPAAGIVNYLEAQAVVRKLEELAAGSAGRAAAVAVMALYPAQVALLREMVRRSPRLAESGLAVEVGLPGAFRHRECLTALVSLTRSHAHRAVPLGEAPDLLRLALTRARERLVLFGDPGTLARRGQWQGPLDHLGEPAAAREARVVNGLLKYVQGQGRHGRAFRLCEGDGT
jgi:hypothetical protein